MGGTVTNILDDLLLGKGGTTRQAALDELEHIFKRIAFRDMEPCEIVAFVTLLRPVHERVMQRIRDQLPPVEPIPLKLVSRETKGVQGGA